MTDELTRITGDIEYIIDYFNPVLNALRMNQGSPIFLSSFSSLDNITNFSNISNWVITLLKTNLYDRKVTQVLKYDEKHRILQFYIVLDELFFKNAEKTKEIRNIIIVHEFIHFLALFYSSIGAKEEILHKKLVERLSRISGAIANENTLKLYKFLNEENLIDDSYSYEQVNDAHFRIGIEKMSLDYAELFRNFLFSHQMLDKYLTSENRKIFFSSLKEHKYKEAHDLLADIIYKIAKEEFLPINFIINQTNDLIMKFYFNKYL